MTSSSKRSCERSSPPSTSGLADLLALFDLPSTAADLDDHDRAIKLMAGAPPGPPPPRPAEAHQGFWSTIQHHLQIQEVRRASGLADVDDDEFADAVQDYWEEIGRDGREANDPFLLLDARGIVDFIAARVRERRLDFGVTTSLPDS
jgi:hypothetical protein